MELNVLIHESGMSFHLFSLISVRSVFSFHYLSLSSSWLIPRSYSLHFCPRLFIAGEYIYTYIVRVCIQSFNCAAFIHSLQLSQMFALMLQLSTYEIILTLDTQSHSKFWTLSLFHPIPSLSCSHSFPLIVAALRFKCRSLHTAGKRATTERHPYLFPSCSTRSC